MAVSNENIDYLYKCDICPRSFPSKKGLTMHAKYHEQNGNAKFQDQKYIEKRIANTKSVQEHRKNNPKTRFEDLQVDSKCAYKEALLFEAFLKDSLGLRVTSVTEKIKDFDETHLDFLEQL